MVFPKIPILGFEIKFANQDLVAIKTKLLPQGVQKYKRWTNLRLGSPSIGVVKSEIKKSPYLSLYLSC